MATPYMGLTLPTPTSTPGPDWATQLNTAFTTVDSHDHSSGKGVPIRTAGIAIDADFSINGFNLNASRALRMSNNGSALSLPADLTCLYAAGGNLYYNNSTGQQVQITAGGALNASSIGGIGGDYATSTASVFYTSSTTTFTFLQDTNKYAFLDVGATTIRASGTSPNGVTIKAPAGLGASYNMTAPTALPASTSAVTMDSTGQLATVAGGFIPTGVIMDFGGSSAPTGYLLCDGTAVSRSTYAALFAVISTTFGSGDGSTTFNVPNCQRRVTVGSGGSGTGTLGSTVGSTGGEETHLLIAAESGLPSHTHGVTDPGHTHLAKTGGNGADNAHNSASWGTNNNGSYANTQTMTTVTTGLTVNSVSSADAGSAHNNIQPSLVVTKIIKT